MASALTVLFLGCWPAGQSGAQGEWLPKPSISASPEGVIPVGGNVTIRCWTEHQARKFALSKDGDGNYTNHKDAAGSAAEFPIPRARQDDGGSYTCRYSNGTSSFSEPSDSVQITVEDAGSTSAEGTAPTLLATLSAFSPCPCATDAGSTPTRGTNQNLLGTTSTPSPSLKDADSIPTRGTHPTPLKTTAAQTQPGELESEPNSAIIAGVIVGAAGLFLLLLLLAFLCCRRTRARKEPASRQSRESEPATTVYALVDLGKQQDVPPQEPDPSAEGLTYAELDRQLLQVKQDVPAPAPEPVLYATVSRSQGAPQLPP